MAVKWRPLTPWQYEKLKPNGFSQHVWHSFLLSQFCSHYHHKKIMGQLFNEIKFHPSLLPGHCAVVACAVGKGFLLTNNENFVYLENHVDESELHWTSVDCE
jgi:hypothetical protein